MKVVILYRSGSVEAREVEQFVRDFAHHHTGGKLEMIDVDTRDGSATATLYDVLSFPSVLALADDGQLLKSWQGGGLPLMNEVAYYTNV